MGSPLESRRILVTRAAEHADGLAGLLRERGAVPLIAPLIEIHPPADRAKIEVALRALDTYDWLVFTSRSGVERFFAEAKQAGIRASSLERLRIATVGPATARAIERESLRVECVPDEHRNEGLAEAVLRVARSGERVLLPRALVAREVLPEMLLAGGLEVDVVPVYETHRVATETFAPFAEELRAGSLDAVTLTSSSTATHLAELLGPDAGRVLAKTVVASIGPITTETAHGFGIRVHATASPHTMPALVTALETVFCRDAGSDRQ